MAKIVKEEIITAEVLTERVDALKSDGDKKEFLKAKLKDKQYEGLRREIINKLVPLIVKNPVATNTLMYDSFSEGVEPIYFWIIDFMRDRAPGGLGMDVQKSSEEYEASAGSGYFGEIGARSTQMQQKAADYLGAINQVIKAIVNLLYDLREFKIRLGNYDDTHSNDSETRRNGEHALKNIWMDQVDIKKGRGSINMLAQDLRFVTLRDAFFASNNIKEINDPKKGLDLNKRVRNILSQKYDEFNKWKIYSESEIRKRYEIERKYLKAQEGSLRLYASWVKPYLKAAQKLKMKEFNTPDIVASFSNTQMRLEVYGSKEVTSDKIHKELKGKKLSKKYFAVVMVELDFRSVPQTMQGQGGRHYVHGGRVDVKFKGYSMDETELDAIRGQELYDDMNLVDDWVGGSLKLIQEEIDTYFNPQEALPKERKKVPIANPFSGTLTGFREMFEPLLGIGSLFRSPAKKHAKDNFLLKKLDAVTEKEAKDLTWRIYNIYKKTHKMIAW